MTSEQALFEKGLYFAERALEVLQGDASDYEVILATILLPIGIELVLKSRLRKEHWSLCIDNPKDAKLKKWEDGDFQTAGFAACLDRLENVTGKEIRQRKSFESQRRRRNKLEHFGLIETVEAMKASAAEALDALFVFIDEFVDRSSISEEAARQLESLRKGSAVFIVLSKRK